MVMVTDMNKRSLMDHQIKALEYCHRVGNPALLMEMRLGKTLTYIRYIQEVDEKRVTPKQTLHLVVAPLSVCTAWMKELNEEEEAYLNLTRGTSTSRLEQVSKLFDGRGTGAVDRLWAVINYEGLRSCMDMAFWKWDSVCCDESTRLKNPKAQITELVTSGFRTVPIRAILTGLVAPEGALDVFMQMKFVMNRFLGHSQFWTFRSQYFLQGDYGSDWHPRPPDRKPSADYKGDLFPGTIKKINDELHKTCYVLKRKDAKIGSKKIYSTRTIMLPPPLLAQYKSTARNMEMDGHETMYSIVLNNWLGRMAGGFNL